MEKSWKSRVVEMKTTWKRYKMKEENGQRKIFKEQNS